MKWLLLTCLLLGGILATKSETIEEEKTLTINGFKNKGQNIENRIEDEGLEVQNIAGSKKDNKKKKEKKKNGKNGKNGNKPVKTKKQRKKNGKIRIQKQNTKRPKHKKKKVKKVKKGKKVRNIHGKEKAKNKDKSKLGKKKHKNNKKKVKKGKKVRNINGKGKAKNKDKPKQGKKKHKNNKKKGRKQIRKKGKGKRKRKIGNNKKTKQKAKKFKRKQRKEKAKKRKNKKKFRKEKGKKKYIKNKKKSSRGKKLVKQATEMSCEEIILSRIKLERKAVNYMRQFNRSKRFMGKTDNKLKKKGIWLKSDQKQDPISLLIKCGGNDENNLKCAGATSNNNSVKMTTLLNNLKNCTPNIGSQCDEGKFPAKDLAFDQCASNLMAYQAKSLECLKKDGAGACACYSTTEATDLYDKGKACSASLMQKYERNVLKTKDNCVTKFKDCRTYQDKLAQVMMTCCGDGGECPAA